MRRWREDIGRTSVCSSSAIAMRDMPSMLADLLALSPALGRLDARALAVIPANTVEIAHPKRHAPG
jgi:hypothetical protein